MAASRFARNISLKITMDAESLYGWTILGSAACGGAYGCYTTVQDFKHSEDIVDFSTSFIFRGTIGTMIGGIIGIFSPITLPLGLIGAGIYTVKKHNSTNNIIKE